MDSTENQLVIKKELTIDGQRSFSDFVVYVDESGDHGLIQLDKDYPVFVLAFCIFYKEHYLSKVVPELQRLKFDYFGHDLVILHKHEIRKEKGDFTIFRTREAKNHFLKRLNIIINESNFILSACVIEKHKMNINKDEVQNPYHIALRYCLETLYDFVAEKGQQERETHVIVEQRGSKEDKELELEFLRICNGENKYHRNLPFKIRMAAKTSNSSGLQLADLVARPIGRHILKPEQANQAFAILEKKFFCEGGRNKVGEGYQQWGLKVFP
ncbi:DUF3800 domain-containing protein [Xenorhabdus siamensis]|uniref:DUF3800 domain-containing protein n=1 Tax=Xenorhabdus siamensis TaxID=3136254 RepID=UPI0030F3AD78